MDQAFIELSEPEGYPELSERAIVDRHIEEMEAEFESIMELREQMQVERENEREWRRSLQAEAERHGYSSVEEMLASEDDEDDDWFDAVDASDILDDHYGSTSGGY